VCGCVSVCVCECVSNDDDLGKQEPPEAGHPHTHTPTHPQTLTPSHPYASPPALPMRLT
jgi:hypothetical protein